MSMGMAWLPLEVSPVAPPEAPPHPGHIGAELLVARRKEHSEAIYDLFNLSKAFSMRL